ncbi:class I SAM-dependent methyltransferase [Vibrio wakamikoensis]|jgi:SAM-dependent methyltransferase|uniref:Class I SAM-dependent methyltransferase n=1 Tax=Vibrio chaetopteri TaxID=3016528 RepID=A0AAU8BPI8_9VIBR
MDNHAEKWKRYYEKSLAKPHAKRTEFALSLNESGLQIAVDCGCGTGSDIGYLSSQGYRVFGFDINAEAVAICRDRFSDDKLVEVSQDTFENFSYPNAGVVIAGASLFFANPAEFKQTWQRISDSIAEGGIFVGDFLGQSDSWASEYPSQTTPLTQLEVESLFEDFDVIRFHERNEPGITAIGIEKHWHIYSVIAVKRG